MTYNVFTGMNAGLGGGPIKVDLPDMQTSTNLIKKDFEKNQKKFEEQQRLEKEAGIYTKLGAMSPEQDQYMKQLQERSQGKYLVSQALAERAQEKVARQMMAAAYARGYDPAAQRAAMRQSSEAQTEIASQAMAAGSLEKSQAMAAYGQMLQYKQQLALTAEQARKAYLMGNKELAQQLTIEMKKIKAGLQGAQMQADAMAREAEARETAAWISGGSTIFTSLIPNTSQK